jgi:hypothetical protein
MGDRRGHSIMTPTRRRKPGAPNAFFFRNPIDDRTRSVSRLAPAFAHGQEVEKGPRRAVAAPAGSTAGIQAGPGSELARLSTPTARHRHSHNHAAGHVAAPGSACSWLDLDVDGRAARRVVFFPFNRWHLRTSYYLARTIRRVIHYQVSSQSTP